ncbi:tetratricopeptide repeat protein [Asaccharospora irregularis]|uniref:Tetratricopeptide repeat-containing protein n=2 Tax=Asaccharospora TaxID=1505660 RepID=A0A1M5N9M0_9FIRM|nr:tetratricopeptide repeat protein [Asaccharospora irregularis]SHG86198.1 Tetratricopeptide repeat-containing protein [Asaccharospora irregularis DSM 2635]
MPMKSTDISSIEEEKSDLTFFNIDDEEENETLKALKQSYVTTNYKEETILNLQATLKNKSKVTSKELKLESYKKYNNAINLANKNYITSALAMIDEAIEINPKDVDILNLRGLLKLLKCDFSKAFESFYTAMCYENNDLSRNYVDLISSEEFKVFLGRYNHSIRFINEDLNHESIHIMNNIIDEDPELIEPYVILSLLYDKMGNTEKRDRYLERLRQVDMDNEIIDKLNSNFRDINDEKEKSIDPKLNKNKTKKNILPYTLILFLLIAVSIYYINNKNKMDELNSQISNKDKKLSEADKELEKASQKLNQTSDELEKAKNEEKPVEVIGEEELYTKSIKLKKDGDYKEAISGFKRVVSSGKTKKYISESIYQLAITNQKIGNKEEAIKYYNKYINTYTPSEEYYDDAYYQLGMLYYEDGDLEKAKKAFYSLRSEVPDSMYNNSKVKDILSKR